MGGDFSLFPHMNGDPTSGGQLWRCRRNAGSPLTHGSGRTHEKNVGRMGVSIQRPKCAPKPRGPNAIRVWRETKNLFLNKNKLLTSLQNQFLSAISYYSTNFINVKINTRKLKKPIKYSVIIPFPGFF